MIEIGQKIYTVNADRYRICEGSAIVKNVTAKTIILEEGHDHTGYKTNIRFNDSRIFLFETYENAKEYSDKRRRDKIDHLEKQIIELKAAIDA